jgi:hypothetical protein
MRHEIPEEQCRRDSKRVPQSASTGQLKKWMYHTPHGKRTPSKYMKKLVHFEH